MGRPDIAIVGGGPSGFFVAEALFKAGIGATVTMFDRLPTPYGLVRSGVAPDHQHIKQVTKVFAAVAANPDFRFVGNAEVGRDVTLEEIRRQFDAVVLSYGASRGRPLQVPGASLPQSYTATEFVGWYNGHPDFAALDPRLDTEAAIVVGHGNVAIDVARMLLCDHARRAKSDMADHALAAFRKSAIRRVHLVGRRGPLEASFTTAELRELLSLPDVRVVIDPRHLDLTADERAFLDLPANAALQRNVAAMSDAASRVQNSATKELHLHFLASPVALDGQDSVSAAQFCSNRLDGPVHDRRAVALDERFSLPTGLVIASIGFSGSPLDGVPFDSGRGIIPNRAGRVEGTECGALYVAGWLKRGATGIIGTNRADAAETVRTLLSDFSDGNWAAKSGKAGDESFSIAGATDFAAWRRIDEIECLAGIQSGQPRRKLVSVAALLEAATGRQPGAAAAEAAPSR